jgi:hypothetical protein
MCPSNRIQETKKDRKNIKITIGALAIFFYKREIFFLRSMDNQRELFFEKGPAI